MIIRSKEWFIFHKMGKRTRKHYKTNKKSKNRSDKFNKSKIKCFKCE